MKLYFDKKDKKQLEEDILYQVKLIIAETIQKETEIELFRKKFKQLLLMIKDNEIQKLNQELETAYSLIKKRKSSK